MNREIIIVRTGIIGICANVFLAGFKAAAGLLSGSIAITLDAVNNLTDALSSVITIISTKLAEKEPDKEHPLGHGRLEYLSTMSISVIILYAGINSLIASVKKILSPETADYSAVTLLIIAVSVAIKIVLGLYVKATGKRVRSDSLVASGKDALLDAVISASTLAAAGVFLVWGVSLEAWLGAVISLIIIKSGYGMLRDSVSLILGERVEGDLARKVRQTVLSFSEVSGVYDLILHSYGPGKFTGSVHIELPGAYTVQQLDVLERNITEKVCQKTGVVLTGIGVYAKPEENSLSAQVFADIRDITAANPHVLQIHGFSANEEKKEIRFDVIIDYAVKNRQEIFENIVCQISKKYPCYTIYPVLDADASDF